MLAIRPDPFDDDACAVDKGGLMGAPSSQSGALHRPLVSARRDGIKSSPRSTRSHGLRRRSNAAESAGLRHGD